MQKYSLLKFTEELDLIDNLIFNLTERKQNDLLISSIGNCEHINNYKINDMNLEVFIDKINKILTYIDHNSKKVFVFVEIKNEFQENIQMKIYNYRKDICHSCKNEVFNSIRFFQEIYKYSNFEYHDPFGLIYSTPLYEEDFIKNNIIDTLEWELSNV